MLDTVIIIPYRNREKQLKYYLKHTVPLLKKHIPNGKVIIVEQCNNKLFNRGCLINIGIKEYQNKTMHYMTHDVDINPTEEFIIKHYVPSVPVKTINGIYIPFDSFLGGIIKTQSETFFHINGFPNNIWGWGAEDKALHARAVFYNINIQKNILHNDANKDKYLLHFKDTNDKNEINNLSNLERYKIANNKNIFNSG